MTTQHGMNGVGPGTLVGHTVRLKRLLGRGGMGSVWVAEHEALETDVAVKFISPEIAAVPEAVARFKREATAAAQLKSPHVVQILDHGVTPDGLPFIVMELLEGEDLATRIGRTGKLPVLEVAAIVSQAAKALGRAHALGIVHRDIKPDNIYLVDTGGESFVKLLDFGIAKRSADAALNMTSTGTMVGTPYFMSPEQVMSAKDADFRSDLWSLAVVTYNALTGRVPFFAETLGALCVAIHAGKFLPVTHGAPELPPALDGWFQRALARDPTARFASAKELADTFAQAAGVSGFEPARVSSVSMARAVSSPPPGFHPTTLLAATVTQPGTPKARKRVALAAVAGVLGAVAIAGGVASRLAQPPDRGFAASTPAPPPSAEPSARPKPAPAPPPTRSAPAPLASSAPEPAASALAVTKPVQRPIRSRSGPPPASASSPRKPAAPATTRKDKDYGF